MNQTAAMLEINSDDMRGRSNARKSMMDRLASGRWLEAIFKGISTTLDMAIVTKAGSVVLL